MKKLITAMVVALVATIINAASIDWSFAELARTTSSPASLDGYSAYLFTASVWEGLSDVTAASFDSAVDSGALTKTELGGGAIYQWQTGTQTWTDNSAASGNYYIVLFNGANYAASSSIAATAYASAQEAHTAAQWQITLTSSPLVAADFTSTGAVPEPTSGLLILLGMAGLALKRKHA